MVVVLPAVSAALVLRVLPGSEACRKERRSHNADETTQTDCTVYCGNADT